MSKIRIGITTSIDKIFKENSINWDHSVQNWSKITLQNFKNYDLKVNKLRAELDCIFEIDLPFNMSEVITLTDLETLIHQHVMNK